MQTVNHSQLLTNYEQSRLIGVQMEETNLKVVSALRHVIQDVFAELSATLVITLMAPDQVINNWFELVLINLVSTWSNLAVLLLRVAQLSDHVGGRKFCNLLLVDSYESFLSANLTVDNIDHNDAEYYFIFLQTRDCWHQHEMQLIFQHCLHYYWLHCNVMVQTGQAEVLIYTYFPYTATDCRSTQPVLVNVYDGERWLNSRMFPNKLRQLHGCPLTVLLWHMPPFVNLSPNGWQSSSGFEVTLVQHLAELMNFNIVERVVYTSTQQLSSSNSNRSAHKPTDILANQLANLSIGCFRRTVIRDAMLTSTVSHYYAPLVGTLERNLYHPDYLGHLTFPFQSCVWQLLLLAVCLHLGIYMWRWRWSAAQVLELLLGVTVWRLPRSWLQRIIYAHWLYGSLPLRIAYQSLLFHFIRLQLFEGVPSSMEDLLDKSFRLLCSFNTLLELREMPQLTQRNSSFIISDSGSDWDVMDQLQLLNGTRVFAATVLDVATAYLIANKRQQRYYSIPQYINLQQLTMYMPKHSYFSEQFSTVIRQLDDHGFLVAWQRAALAEQQIGSRRHSTHMVQPESGIGLIHLSGIFKLIAALHVLAALVLLTELLLHRLHRRGLK